MKPARLMLLIASTMSLAACSSFQPPQPLASASPEPVLVGKRVTAWGELPSYDKEGHYFKQTKRMPPRSSPLSGQAIVDVMVNADGTVRAAAIVETSGNPELDSLALEWLKRSRYSLRLASGQAAPHVVRQEFWVRNQPADREPPLKLDATNYGPLGPNVTSSLAP